MWPRSVLRVCAVLLLAISLGGCAVHSAGPRWGGSGYYPRAYSGGYGYPSYYRGYGGGFGYPGYYGGHRGFPRYGGHGGGPRVERWSQSQFGAHIQNQLRPR